MAAAPAAGRGTGAEYDGLVPSPSSGRRLPLLLRVSAITRGRPHFPSDESVSPVRLPPTVLRSAPLTAGKTRVTHVRQETTDDD